MSVSISKVNTDNDIKKFISVPWQIYKGNKYWVPPLINDMKDIIDAGKNPLFLKGEHQMFLVVRNDKVIGRICTGYDSTLMKEKNSNWGYLTLFECINDYNTAKLLFDTSVKWLKSKGINVIRGPISPKGNGSDEYKGLLINSFDKSPVFMNTYNPQYYVEFFENYGFEKDLDLYAYYLDPKKIFSKNPERILKYAEKKYNFKVNNLDLNNLDDEIISIKYILDLAIPEEWSDMISPSLDDVRKMADQLKKFADPDIIFIARSENEPVGFGIALPDYNQVLKHMNGHVNLWTIMKYLWFKRKINAARFFIMFVIPAYRKKGVSHAIYYNTFLNGLKKGYVWGEGSTIGETNTNMRNDIESFGGKHYKTYRIYKKSI